MWTLAVKLLTHDRFKFAIALAGVSMSVFLVLIQIGLYIGFMRNASIVVDHAKAGIWVVGTGFENLEVAPAIDERTFYRVAETPGVAHAERLLLAWGTFRQRTGGIQSVEVLGLEHNPSLMRPWGVVDGDWRDISAVDGIVVDRSEHAKLLMDRVGDSAEIGGHRARIVALTEGIHSFSTSPYIFTNLKTAREYTLTPADQVEFVLVDPLPGVDLDVLKSRLEQVPYVNAFTAEEMSKNAQTYWASRTGVGAGLFTTAVLGVIVGFVIVGQILYTGTLDHIVEFGTLKAMGTSNGRIAGVILLQAMIAAVLGILIGGGLVLATQRGMRATNLLVVITPELVVGTIMLTLATCSCASMLSILRVFRLEPASVFKG